MSQREVERLQAKLEEKEQRLDEALAREIQIDTTVMQVDPQLIKKELRIFYRD